ncbi:U11/U12 small nuclear ribonucleoprotein 48 kDa protein [Gastrolobium bilobum]|uniref:U11/U12 small nuclear ribonucleoprotein 48 kDa protein n=1 Tax=Gastrolobium bilobum TaxID=150636 RepID=UPI002AB15FEE|nr:U11/U12 small nuclear ribonucleoprotein 48 kDa protein [Gastrolobium bilobum]
MNQFAPSQNPNLSTMLSSLNNLVTLSKQILPILPSPQTLNSNLIQCPFNKHHLLPPQSLFLHHLRCPSSPRPIPDLNNLFHSLTYPKTLNNSHSENLSSYLDFTSNFSYRDCPGVFTFSDSDSINRTFTIPSFLSLECENTHISDLNSRTSPILPSEYCAITRELESWNDYPSSYSNSVLRAILCLGISEECDLANWIVANSPRYGIVVDLAMQQHIFLLCCLCFKSIIREASVSVEKENFQLECPVLNQALAWLASQVSVLYGAISGKFFVLNFVKKCILVGASVMLLFPLGDEVAEAPQESQNSDTVVSVEIKDAKHGAKHEEKRNCIQNRRILMPQVVAAVAALHERSLLEHRIKGLWFSRQPSNYQRVTEHSYLYEKANEERAKRLDYKPLIDHDGLHRQQSSNQETSREKTREELLAEERDYKRRRMSYRGKKRNQSFTQRMRDVIEEFMEEIKQAGGLESPVKVPEESVMFASKPPSGHDIPIEANDSRKFSHDSPAVTISNSSHWEQQSSTNYCGKNKTVDDAFTRYYGEHKQGHDRSHYYGESQQNDYHRDVSFTSSEGRASRSRSREHSIHHKKQDYTNKKKYGNSSRTMDRWQKDSHKNSTSYSSRNNAFSDRYDPSESLDIDAN